MLPCRDKDPISAPQWPSRPSRPGPDSGDGRFIPRTVHIEDSSAIGDGVMAALASLILCVSRVFGVGPGAERGAPLARRISGAASELTYLWVLPTGVSPRRTDSISFPQIESSRWANVTRRLRQ